MFIRNHYYTGDDIFNLKNKDDIILIEGLSFMDKELLDDWSYIHLRYHTSDTENNITYHYFTLVDKDEGRC